jgi:protein-S-isoprenylcysteine O-methyltransferase Ste14
MSSHLPYRALILGLWAAWVLYWVFSARNVKTTQRRESAGSRLSYFVPLLCGAALIAAPHLDWGGWLSMQLLPHTPLRYLLAVLLIALGLGFTVWARIHLGRNWSGSVTLKEGHELIRSGPYAYVRHPIYTGLLVALLGATLANGEPRALIGLALLLFAFVHKLRLEERFMREMFPGQYERYSAEVPALVPFTKARQSAPR